MGGTPNTTCARSCPNLASKGAQLPLTGPTTALWALIPLRAPPATNYPSSLSSPPRLPSLTPTRASSTGKSPRPTHHHPSLYYCECSPCSVARLEKFVADF